MKAMNNFFDRCKSIAVDSRDKVEKDFFDENYGFRHIPVIFRKAFSDWEVNSNHELITNEKPIFFQCWYEEYASNLAPKKQKVNLNNINSYSSFKKNNWDLSSLHYLADGYIDWLFYPPLTLEYLQLDKNIPEACSSDGLHIDIFSIAERYNIKPMKITQRAGELLFIPPMYAYSYKKSTDAIVFSDTILTEYNHDNLYAYFRKTNYKAQIKQIILNGFTNTKHLSVYETPTQRLSNQAAAA
jgi:hypothetical protein